jgi:4'-phosphopantetheinyl transferase
VSGTVELCAFDFDRAGDPVAPYRVLRELAARRLGRPAASLHIVRRCAVCGSAEHGKPLLDGPAGDTIDLSVAHSGAVAVVAVATGARVGVDVEVVRPRVRLDRLAARVLAPADLATWQRIADPDAALRVFLRAWTTKEAYLKGLGIGVTRSLRDTDPVGDGWHVAVLDEHPRGCITAIATDTPVAIRYVDAAGRAGARVPGDVPTA